MSQAPINVSKLLGIDYGSRRIGLALANTEARLASPLAVWSNSGELLSRLTVFIKQEKITIVIVGLPRGLEGQETAQSRTTRQFAQEVARTGGIKVLLQDEALTSVIAADRLVPKRWLKTAVDARAAALILQDYLDRL